MSGSSHCKVDHKKSRNPGSSSQEEHESHSRFEWPLTGQHTYERSPRGLTGSKKHSPTCPTLSRDYCMTTYRMNLTSWARLTSVSIAVGLACITTGAAMDALTPFEGVSPGIDEKSVANTVLSAMDRNADPYADLFQYACGSWGKVPSKKKAKAEYDDDDDDGQSISRKSISTIRGRMASIIKNLLEKKMRGRSIASDFYFACITKIRRGSLNFQPL